MWIFLFKVDDGIYFLLSNVIVYVVVWIALELNCRKFLGKQREGKLFSIKELINNIKAGICTIFICGKHGKFHECSSNTCYNNFI